MQPQGMAMIIVATRVKPIYYSCMQERGSQQIDKVYPIHEIYLRIECASVRALAFKSAISVYETMRPRGQRAPEATQ